MTPTTLTAPRDVPNLLSKSCTYDPSQSGIIGKPGHKGWLNTAATYRYADAPLTSYGLLPCVVEVQGVEFVHSEIEDTGTRQAFYFEEGAIWQIFGDRESVLVLPPVDSLGLQVAIDVAQDGYDLRLLSDDEARRDFDGMFEEYERDIDVMQGEVTECL